MAHYHNIILSTQVINDVRHTPSDASGHVDCHLRTEPPVATNLLTKCCPGMAWVGSISLPKAPQTGPKQVSHAKGLPDVFGGFPYSTIFRKVVPLR